MFRMLDIERIGSERFKIGQAVDVSERQKIVYNFLAGVS